MRRPKVGLAVMAMLSACFWSDPGAAQAWPSGIAPESRSGTQTGPDRASTSGEAGSHRLHDAKTSSASAKGRSAQLQRRALAAMDALREEIATLTALKEAQAALLAWNRESARTGELPQALPIVLCAEPAISAWCSLLPATFGAASTEDGDG